MAVTFFCLVLSHDATPLICGVQLHNSYRQDYTEAGLLNFKVGLMQYNSVTQFKEAFVMNLVS
jgi:hypothetical protein